MKTITLKSVVSLLFAMLISVPGMSQDNDGPGESSGLMRTDTETNDERQTLNPVLGEEPWLDAALLRYRNLKQRNDRLESEWLKQLEATLARVAALTNASRTPLPGSATLVSTTEQKLALQPGVLEELAVSTQSSTPLLESTASPRPNTSLDSEKLKCLKECLCQLENRVSQLERKLAAGDSLNVSNTQMKESQQ